MRAPKMDALLAMTTDFRSSTDDPAPALAAIAAAGFTHAHWCHQWNTNKLYEPAEIRTISHVFRDNGLALLDLHASLGQGVAAWAPVDLVVNRIRMTAELGGRAIVLHPPPPTLALDDARRALDALVVHAESLHVRIALENLDGPSWDAISTLLVHYPVERVGLCYDSGHANVAAHGPDKVELFAHRLHAVHLHDNDGSGDQHRLPFDGSVDWRRVAQLLGRSSHADAVTLESNLRTYPAQNDERRWLRDAHAAAGRIAEMMR
jgi:sugar phosphate isomerase/epimerase